MITGEGGWSKIFPPSLAKKVYNEKFNEPTEMIRWTKDRVIVEVLENKKTGILFPANVQPKMQTGRVLGVGAKAHGIKTGDIIYFLKWVGNPIVVDNKDAICLSAYHIIGQPI